MKPLLFLIALFFCSHFTSQASNPSSTWHSGQVQLESGDWLVGDLRYDPVLRLVEFGLDGTVQTFTATRVRQFYFYDSEESRTRTFVTLPYDPKGQHNQPTFFEILVKGRVKLLAQEQILPTSLLRRLIGKCNNNYYLEAPDGHIVAYRGRLKQLYAMLGDHREEVDFFVNRVHWYRCETKPIAELVRFYNSLQTTEAAE